MVISTSTCNRHNPGKATSQNHPTEEIEWLVVSQVEIELIRLVIGKVGSRQEGLRWTASS